MTPSLTNRAILIASSRIAVMGGHDCQSKRERQGNPKNWGRDHSTTATISWWCRADVSESKTSQFGGGMQAAVEFSGFVNDNGQREESTRVSSKLWRGVYVTLVTVSDLPIDFASPRASGSVGEPGSNVVCTMQNYIRSKCLEIH